MWARMRMLAWWTLFSSNRNPWWKLQWPSAHRFQWSRLGLEAMGEHTVGSHLMTQSHSRVSYNKNTLHEHKSFIRSCLGWNWACCELWLDEDEKDSDVEEVEVEDEEEIEEEESPEPPPKARRSLSPLRGTPSKIPSPKSAPSVRSRDMSPGSHNPILKATPTSVTSVSHLTKQLSSLIGVGLSPNPPSAHANPFSGSMVRRSKSLQL